MKKYNYLRGLSVTFIFISALFLSLEMIATSSSDYKTMIDGFFNVNFNKGNDNLETYVFKSDYKDTVEMLTKRQQIACQIAEEGAVLLKNENNCLPLSNKEKKVTVLGSRAFTYDKNGDLRDTTLSFYGGIQGSKIYRQEVTLSRGKISLPITLEDGFSLNDIIVNPSCKEVYSNKNFPSLPVGSEANGQSGGAYSVNEPLVNASDFANTSEYNDACFVVIGRASGEGREYFPGQNGIADKQDGSKSSLNLSNNERHLIEEAKKISNKVIVLINSAIPMEIDELKEGNLASLVDSILWIGLPGSYGMEGISNIICGKVSPSGSLSDTFSSDASCAPASQNFGISGQNNEGNFSWSNPGWYTKADNNHYVVLAEDIYTGYYYYETRYNDCIENRGQASSGVGIGRNSSLNWEYDKEITYPFGYGLSYSTFETTLLKEKEYNPEDNTLTFKVNVKNTGNVAGKKNVQLYVSSPHTNYDIENGIEKSAIQLISFAKSDILYPLSESNDEKKNSQTLELKVDLSYVASYDKTCLHDNKVGGYILEDADYYFAIGDDSHQALNNVLVNKDSNNENKIFSESWANVNKDNVIKWNPALEEKLTSLDNGKFVNGINATLLNTNKEGVIVENQLQNADYNYFKENTITYLSRSNWKDTFPKAYTNLEVVDGMRKYLGTSENNAGRVYEFKTGSSNVEFGVDYSLEDEENSVIAQYKGFAYEDEAWDKIVKQVTFDEAWLFAPYGGSNCEALKSVNAPLAWQIDGPNGNVTRSIGNKAPSKGYLSVDRDDPNYNYLSSDMPCEGMLSSTYNKELAYEQGKIYGEDGLWSRNVFMWAPGMNLHRTPFNSRNHEYYSEDPMLTNIIGVHFVRGGLEKGMILSAKHFAFNTQESYREGLSQFMEEQSARELELRAFQGLFKDVKYKNNLGNEINALGLMSSFSRIGVCGVNAHTGLMKNILRGEWLFRGSISTDMVVEGRYFNPQDAVINNVTFMAASNSIKLLREFWSDYNNKQKVRNDPYLCEAIQQNMHHYLYTIANSNLLNGMDSNTKIVDESSLKSPWEYVLIYSSIGLGIVSGGLFILYYLKNLKKEKENA